MNPVKDAFEETKRKVARALVEYAVPGSSLRAPLGSPQSVGGLEAKIRAAERIKAEMLRDFRGHNDAGDALRHAELSRRLASQIDPGTAYLAGVAHEIENSLPVSWQRFAPARLREHAAENWHGQDPAEARMDLNNNAEGRRAAWEGRPVDPNRLQIERGVTPPSARYRDPAGRR